MHLHWYTQLLRAAFWFAIGAVFYIVVLRPIWFEQLPRVRGWLHQLNKIPCDVCGCTEWTINHPIYESFILVEHRCDCKVCGAVMNYFAYGNFEHAFTYTENIKRRFFAALWNFKERKFLRDLERWRRKH